MMTGFSIRSAVSGDESLVRALLGELAAFENLTEQFFLTEVAVARDLIGAGKVASCELLFVGEEIAGIAVWFWTYRSFKARRGLFVEDLYVRPRFRGVGLGKALLAHLARTALKGGGWMEWLVLDWNAPALTFYQGLGATPVKDWIGYKLEGASLEKLGAA